VREVLGDRSSVLLDRGPNEIPNSPVQWFDIGTFGLGAVAHQSGIVEDRQVSVGEPSSELSAPFRPDEVGIGQRPPTQ
jgi:hypothetical protein